MAVYLYDGERRAYELSNRGPIPRYSDRTIRADLRRAKAWWIRATGTDDHQQYRQQRTHEATKCSATQHDKRSVTAQRADKRNPLRIAKQRNITRRHATRNEKATSGIRTPDLCFTKALLYH